MEFTSRRAFEVLQPELMLPAEALQVSLDYENATYKGGSVHVLLSVARAANEREDKYGIFPTWLNFEPIKETYFAAEISENELRGILGEYYARKIADQEDTTVRKLRDAVLQEIQFKNIRNSEEIGAFITFLTQKATYGNKSDSWIKIDYAVNNFHSRIGYIFYKNNL